MVGREEDGTFEYVRICSFPIPSQTHLLLPFFLTQQNTTKPKHNNKSLKKTKNLHPHKNKNKNKKKSTTLPPPPQQQQYLHHHNQKNNTTTTKIFTTTTTTTTTILWVNFKCVANRFLGTTPQPNAELERQI
jgi:hypothetical protein